MLKLGLAIIATTWLMQESLSNVPASWAKWYRSCQRLCSLQDPSYANHGQFLQARAAADTPATQINFECYVKNYLVDSCSRWHNLKKWLGRPITRLIVERVGLKCAELQTTEYRRCRQVVEEMQETLGSWNIWTCEVAPANIVVISCWLLQCQKLACIGLFSVAPLPKY